MDTLKPGEIRQVAGYELRNVHGYRQSREGSRGRWRFHVSGFDSSSSGEAGFCSVVLATGGVDTVPIDAQNRITICGRKYGPANWLH